MNSTITELNKRLPVDAVTEAVAELADSVVETVQRVGSAVGDHVPESVPDALHDAVADGMSRGRSLLDRLPTDRLPSRSHPSSRARTILIAASTVVVIGTGIVVWRRRCRASAAPVADDWSTPTVVRDVA